MKIETIETFVAHTATFVRLRTDTGLEGIGECTMFAFPEAPASVIRRFEPMLIGADPMRVEYLWLKMYRSVSMRGMSITGALSAIDQALWDIRGKHFGVPVWEALGGRARDKVRAMLVLDYDTVEGLVAQASAAVKAGYTALKVLLFQAEHHPMTHAARVKDMVERMQALRETVGWTVDLGVELHRNMMPGDSIALMRELEVFRPFFVEDPIPPDSVFALGEISKKSRLPMAAGERTTSIWEFAEYIDHAGLSYVRPDIGIAGGFTQLRKICAMAEAHHLAVLPHSVPNGPVATAAHVHMGLAAPTWDAQEYRVLKEPHLSMVDHVIQVRDGFFDLPDRPGLGMTLNDKALVAMVTPPRTTEVPHRMDGSIAFR
jgi:galactonate dehydratase